MLMHCNCQQDLRRSESRNMDINLLIEKDMLLSMAASGDMRRSMDSNIISRLSRLNLSSASLSKEVELIPQNRVNISDLVQSTSKIFYGKYFLCRTIAPNFQKRAIHVVVDDPEGISAISVCLYKYRGGETPVFPVGTILAIKNPFFEYDALVGCTVWITNAAEFVIIDDSKDLGVEWKAPIPAKYQIRSAGQDPKATCKAELEKVGPTKETETPEVWKILGNKYFEEKKHDLALEAYGRGLALSPNHIALLSNRSLLNLNMENYTEAFSDADAVLQIQPNHVKALYRKACAIIGLRKYQEALEFLQGLTPENPEKDLVNLKATLDQQLRGIYDMNYFLNNIETKKFSTCAEYSVGFELVKTPKNGRGIAKSSVDLKAGQLIIVSKAFVVADNIELEVSGSPSRNSISISNRAALKLKKQPDLGEDFYSMYAGPNVGYLEGTGQRLTETDMNEIESICLFNNKSSTESDVTSGIWFKPSFLRHSCVNYNANWMLRKDFMFVRATKDIKKAEEITMPYVPFLEAYKQRRKHLQEVNYECKCDLCQLEEKEPESIHKLREVILKQVEQIPHLAISSQRQLETLKMYARQLDELRPNNPMNFPLFEVQQKLAAAYVMSGNAEEAMAILKLIYEKTAHYAHMDSMRFALQYAMACMMSNNILCVKQFLPKWKQQMKLVYGTEIGKETNVPGLQGVDQIFEMAEIIP